MHLYRDKLTQHLGSQDAHLSQRVLKQNTNLQPKQMAKGSINLGKGQEL